jgi:hypothetical protein
MTLDQETHMLSEVKTSILVLASLVVAAPAFAASAYDGNWSVVIATTSGGCDPTVRYPVAITNGMVVNAGDNPATVQGRVTPRGMVNVSVQSGGQWANGAGRLGMNTGSGVWRGQGSAGACAGTWVAQRRTAAGVAEVPPGAAEVPPGAPANNYPPRPNYYAQEPNYNYQQQQIYPQQPVYDYAPRPLAEQAQGQNAAMAACAARFHSYDPASGTYLGIDGARHPCP